MSILDAKTEGELVQKALKIHDHEKSATKAVLEADIENLCKILVEFTKLKKEIKESILDIPSLTINNNQALDILRKISSDYEFQCDKYFKKIYQMEGFDWDKVELFDDEEIESIGWDIFHSWFSHYDYVESMLKINSLLLGTSIPKELESYVNEARKCYSFKQYVSVYSLCRTILESTVRNIGQRKKKLPKDKGNVKNLELRNWNYMKNKVVPKGLKGEAEKIYDLTSGLIHGRSTIGKDDAFNMFKRTIDIVQNLYDYYFSGTRQPIFKR